MTGLLGRSSQVTLLILLISGISLGGCLGLADDVPPPQVVQITEPPPNAPLPSPTPIPEKDPIQDEGNTDLLQGEVFVEVLDHSRGKIPIENIEIRLEGYDEFKKSYEEAQNFPADSLAVFSEVPFKTGRVYFASIDYGGAVYRSMIHQVDSETEQISLQVAVYETTTDASGIIVDRIHVLIDYSDSESVQVSEIIILSNLEDKTVVAGDSGQPVLIFPLPEGASEIQFENGAFGQRFIHTEDGFGDTVSIPPGSGVYQVLVHYRLPFNGFELDYSQPMNYPVSDVVVMTPAGQLKINDEFFQDLGVQSIPSGDVQVYSGGGISRGDALEFRITGFQPSLIEQPITVALDLNPYVMVIGIVGVGLILAGIFLFTRNQKRSISIDVPAGEEDEKNKILDMIIALEDLYNEGEISEEDYHRKRQELKGKLSNLVQGKP